MSDDTAIEYCIRCDQPGRVDEMEPLWYGFDAEETPEYWLHIKCRNAHGRAAFAAQIAAFADGIREMVQTERSDGVVDLKRIRAASELADSSTETVAAFQRWEAARAKLERLGIDPDDIPT